MTRKLISIAASVICVAASPVAANEVSTSCWRANGYSQDAEWTALGGCHRTPDKYGMTSRITVLKPRMTVQGVSTGLKPYQNPIGSWMHCINSICALIPY